jgi:hypothetical protein
METGLRFRFSALGPWDPEGQGGRMTAKGFSMGEAISFGWETTKSNFPFFIGLMVVVWLIAGVPQFFSSRSESSALAFLLGVVSFVLNTIVGMGLIRITLKFCDRQSPEFGDLFAPAPLFFIVPGIILAIVFGFYAYVIIDRGAGPIEALSRAAGVSKDVRWTLFGFGLLLIGLNILGALALLVGLFVTIPISMVAVAYVYRQLDAQTSAVTA